MKRRKRPGHLMSNMNVVPYIDVMLVLLIIFMVTAPMFVPAVINLPSVGKASSVTSSPIEVAIDSHNNYSIEKDNKTTRINGLEHLVSSVKRLSQNNEPVVISADKEVRYDNVIKVVDKLYGAGIKKVAVVVKERNG